MSGETQKNESGWTVDTLKEYVDRRFEDNQEAVDAALVSQEKAVIKVEVATEKRFESVNEFRRTLSDQTNTFIPRNEYIVQHEALADLVKLNTVDNEKNSKAIAILLAEKKGSQLTKGNIIAYISVVGVILGIIVVVANWVSK